MSFVEHKRRYFEKCFNVYLLLQWNNKVVNGVQYCFEPCGILLGKNSWNIILLSPYIKLFIILFCIFATTNEDK